MASQANVNSLRVAALAAIAVFHPAAAHATKPGIRATVVGCVIDGRIVPYAKYRTRAQRLPQWVRVSGGKKAEGKEIRMTWSGCLGCGPPNFALPNNNTHWETTGACDHSQLPPPLPLPASR